MRAVGERDVDHDGAGEGEQTLAQQVAELPGGFAREVWEGQGGVDAVDFVKLARREGNFGGHLWDWWVCLV